MQDEFDIPLNLLEGAALSPLDPAVQASTVVRENGANLNPPIGPSTSYVFGYYRAGIDGQSRPETGPWPWPSLIRITIRLVDPEDRQVETTYQATFRVPDRSSF
jgi:hypothetical protein